MPGRGDDQRVDGPDLHEHAAGAHHHERGVGPEDAHPEVQLPRHRHLEPVDGQGQGDRRLWRRRVPQHDLRGERHGQHPGAPHARIRV